MANRTKSCLLICCALLLGWGGPSMARNSGSRLGTANALFIAEEESKAQRTPGLQVLLQIPVTTFNDGDDIQIFCNAGAFIGEGFNPRKRVRGVWQSRLLTFPDTNAPDLEVTTSDLGNGNFRTNTTGLGQFSFPVSSRTLTDLLPGRSVAAQTTVEFTNGKVVSATSLVCVFCADPPVCEGTGT